MPETTEKVSIHIDAAHKRDDLPDIGPDTCPDCRVPYEVGFGLAGGGYGAYTYCPECGKLLSKTEETDD